jgi:GntR family transcriptional regulator/MocR family aminotransferase
MMTKYSQAEHVLAVLDRLFDRSSSTPRQRQLYELVRQLIIVGEIGAGVRLPSSRLIAQELNLSRHTVLSAIEQLVGEGYLVGRHGSGTYVSHHFARDATILTTPPRITSTVGDLSTRGRKLTQSQQSPFRWDDGNPASTGTFRVGMPATDAFPVEQWARAISAAWRANSGRLSYQQPKGHQPLRDCVAAYLHASRGLRCDPEQIVITTGSQSALDLSFRLLIDPGDIVAVEDPGYLGARLAVESAGGVAVAVPVDSQGIRASELADMKQTPKAVFVTPTHQFPTGATMTLERRLQLIDWARRSDSWIIEDDYDSEYRYGGRRFDPLTVLDQSDRAIYVGTFSKVMFPALRIGYLVLPAGLVGSFETAHVASDIHRALLEQAALAIFIEGGNFARHLRRSAALHAERRLVLLHELKDQLAGIVTIEPAIAGLHLLARLPPGVNDIEVCRRALDSGSEPWPLSIHYMAAPQHGLLLGFGGSTPEAIRRGVRDIAQILATPLIAR